MIEIMEGIYTGSEQDYYQIKDKSCWGVLHCCKNPFHLQFVGYRGNLSSDHPDYALKRKDNEMALNLVDMDQFSEKYLDLNKGMFSVAFEFLDEHRGKGKKLLIHCNQGESRGPTIGLLYVSRLGKYDYADFDTSVANFKSLYPRYSPKGNIYFTTQALWGAFVTPKAG